MKPLFGKDELEAIISYGRTFCSSERLAQIIDMVLEFFDLLCQYTNKFVGLGQIES